MKTKYIDAYIKARMCSKWNFTPIWLCLDQLNNPTIKDAKQFDKLVELVEGVHEPKARRYSKS